MTQAMQKKDKTEESIKKDQQETKVSPPAKPVLRLSPTAWAKLLYFRDHGESEIGGFGITSQDDLLRIEEFATVKQEATMASVSFDDEAVADFFETQVDAGRKPQQFARIWLHTHPGDSPQPSSVDEETFRRVFGKCDWAVMFVLARNGKTYARLRFNVGPGGEVVIPVEVDYACPFGSSDREAWKSEYKANIKADSWLTFGSRRNERFESEPETADLWAADDWLDAFETLEPDQRQLVLDEITSRSDLWDQESEVMWI